MKLYGILRHPSISFLISIVRHYAPTDLWRVFDRAGMFIIGINAAKDIQKLKEIVERNIMTLTMEITNICNANCQFCAYRFQKRKEQIMSNELFKRSINQFARSHGGIVSLTPIVGDPLIDKDLIKKIKYAKKMKEIRYLYFFTNMIGFNSFNVTDFLLSGVDEINVSACIGSRDMYKRIFGVDRYDSFIKNLEGLLKENRRLRCKVKINVHIKCEKPHTRIKSSSDYQRVSDLYGRAITHIDYEYDNWTGIIKEENLPKNNTFVRIKDMSEPCSSLYSGVIVFANGDVGICECRDFEAKLVIGNIYESSLDDIWRGKKVRRIRENWLKGNIPVICRKCYRYRSLSDFLSLERARARIVGMNHN